MAAPWTATVLTIPPEMFPGPLGASLAGAALGQVVAVRNFGAGDLSEIRPATGGKTVLVPFTRETVPEIDRAAGWLLLCPPEGLFEE